MFSKASKISAGIRVTRNPQSHTWQKKYDVDTSWMTGYCYMTIGRAVDGQRKAVAKFRLTTGHGCLLKHLPRIHVAQAPVSTLCDFQVNMDADHIHRYPVLKGSSLCNLCCSPGRRIGIPASPLYSEAKEIV
ncbi:hypothetical protein TNCV_4662381 [Trichonephila clavipes]|uniref:Uncharacterized protein n=1 Tax=Trichonephila clavipes TaxID=2585209 RepID=A0A8X6S7V8_TRICX|nr:hypothetical protein TNCV_4662381 [Trichonephila clavipes]